MRNNVNFENNKGFVPDGDYRELLFVPDSFREAYKERAIHLVPVPPLEKKTFIQQNDFKCSIDQTFIRYGERGFGILHAHNTAIITGLEKKNRYLVVLELRDVNLFQEFADLETTITATERVPVIAPKMSGKEVQGYHFFFWIGERVKSTECKSLDGLRTVAQIKGAYDYVVIPYSRVLEPEGVDLYLDYYVVVREEKWKKWEYFKTKDEFEEFLEERLGVGVDLETTEEEKDPIELEEEIRLRIDDNPVERAMIRSVFSGHTSKFLRYAIEKSMQKGFFDFKDVVKDFGYIGFILIRIAVSAGWLETRLKI